MSKKRSCIMCGAKVVAYYQKSRTCDPCRHKMHESNSSTTSSSRYGKWTSTTGASGSGEKTDKKPWQVVVQADGVESDIDDEEISVGDMEDIRVGDIDRMIARREWAKCKLDQNIKKLEQFKMRMVGKVLESAGEPLEEENE